MYSLVLRSPVGRLWGSSVLSTAFFFFFRMALMPSRESAVFADACYEPLGVEEDAAMWLQWGGQLGCPRSGIWPT